LLSALGHEVIVANARNVRLIGESRKKKDDRLDAQTLARLVRIDPQLLSPVKHRSAQAQADLRMIRARAGVVRTQTALTNTARGLANSYGVRLRGCKVRNLAEKVFGPGCPQACGPQQLDFVAGMEGSGDRTSDRRTNAFFSSAVLTPHVCSSGGAGSDLSFLPTQGCLFRIILRHYASCSRIVTFRSSICIGLRLPPQLCLLLFGIRFNLWRYPRILSQRCR
jgi:transposase